MAVESKSDVLRRVTKAYIDSIDMDNPPTPQEAQQELLEQTQKGIGYANVVIPTKDRMIKQVSKLEPRQIAELMIKLDHAARIALAGGNGDYDALAVYCKDGALMGTYTLAEDAIRKAAAAYMYDISVRDMAEVEAVLMREAPRVTVCNEPNLIAVNNGVFDYDTKTLSPFTPEKVFLSKCAVNYNPAATSPVIVHTVDGTAWEIEEWMKELSDDEGVPELLWQIIGAVIRPNVSWNKSAWLYSESGNNGKGTLCSLMRNICGGCHTSLPISEMGKDFMLETLVGKSAIITDENDVGVYIDRAANLKAIITGDPIMINRKYKQPITYRFRGFMVQCLNELPKIRDRSNSIYRRQLFIPFRKCFTGKERKYIKDDYLCRQDVLEYVLKRVLEMDYYELDEPEACRVTLDEYKVTNDPVREFWLTFRNAFVWELLPWEYLYDLYKAWFKENNPNGTLLASNRFISALKLIVSELDAGIWEAVGDTRPKNMMNKAEYLSVRYDLTQWMVNGRTGPACRQGIPPLKSKYRGLKLTDIGKQQRKIEPIECEPFVTPSTYVSDEDAAQAGMVVKRA